jgi:hypothetical protein
VRRVDSEGELAGVLRSGGGVLGHRSGEQVKELAEWTAGVLVMLVRARREGGGLKPELSTAALRWRPRGLFWAAWRRERAPARGNGRWKMLGATRGCQRESEGGRLALHGGRRHCTAATAGEAGKQAGGRGKGTQMQFPKIPGT